MTILKGSASILSSRSDFYGLVIGIVCTAGVWVTAPMEATSAQNQSAPKTSAKVEGDPRAGKVLFDQHCVTCHGPKGRGDGIEIAGATVADLSSPRTQRQLDLDLLATIHEGRPGKVMPSWEYRLSKEQSRDVLAYIRTLGRK